MTEQEHELVQSILKVVGALPAEFGVMLDPEDYGIVYDYEDKLRAAFPRVQVANGVTKMVIIHPDLPFVIKIPFNGYWAIDYNSEDENIFIPFECATCTGAFDGEWDYCKLETEEYACAQDRGFNCFLAKSEFIGYYCNYPIYIQEKVNVGFRANSRIVSSAKSRESVNNLDFCDRICSDIWMSKCFDCYGEELTMAFVEYTHHEDNMVGSDDHSKNYGYRNDGTPCLLDYSGYND